MRTKQVIVIRRDLKMRRGKEIAQGSHASQAWLLKRIADSGVLSFNEAERDWLAGDFRKVVVIVDSEAEIDGLHLKALELGVQSHVITDHGLTEFHGVLTVTAMAIGPDFDEKIDPITQHLRLY